MLYRRLARLGVAIGLVVATACGGDDDTPLETANPAALPAGVPPGAQAAEVAAANDAGHIRVSLRDATGSTLPGSGVLISVIGVDPPDPGQCLALESEAFAEGELPVGTVVYLVGNEAESGPDGALPRFVWDGDGELYNDKVLRQGFATAVPTGPDVPVDEGLVAAEAEARAASRGVWGCPTAPTPTAPVTTRPSTPTPTPPPTVATTAPPVATTAPPGRTASLGATFSISVGESVGITGEGLTVTYTQLVTDNRCPSGVQCIVAGNATIAVTVAKAGSGPASLSLNTDEGPTSASYLTYTVELVQLNRGPSPAARLLVT